jgi:hypothetical protein
VYDITTGERLFVTPDHYPKFSSNTTLLMASDDGIYDESTGERLFEMQEYGSSNFSPDGNLNAVSVRGCCPYHQNA